MTEIMNRIPQEEARAIALQLPSSVLENVLRQRYELEANEKVRLILESCPAECVPHQLVSSYYGSHSERGEDDSYFWVAIPEGAELPDIHIGHGSYGSNTDDLALLPVGSYVNWDDDWEAVLSWRQPVSLDLPLPIPDGFIAVEARIMEDGEWGREGETLHALQADFRAERMEGETPKFYRYGSFSDIEYFEHRLEGVHQWERQGGE